MVESETMPKPHYVSVAKNGEVTCTDYPGWNAFKICLQYLAVAEKRESGKNPEKRQRQEGKVDKIPLTLRQQQLSTFFHYNQPPQQQQRIRQRAIFHIFLFVKDHSKFLHGTIIVPLVLPTVQMLMYSRHISNPATTSANPNATSAISAATSATPDATSLPISATFK